MSGVADHGDSSSLVATLAMLHDPATTAWMDPEVWGPDVRTRYQPLTAATFPGHDQESLNA